MFADPAQLEGALLNLALNARDAMPRGGRLSFSAREHPIADTSEGVELPAGRYIRMTISDTGLGMPPDVLARAFEPFFTTKESGKGSGLGLSMVYGFVKQSGGHLVAQSQLGYGTQMDLILPLAPTAVVGPATVQATPGLRGNETVLVVEDEPEVRGVAVAFLRALGYAVHEAGDAEQALQHLRDDPAIALLFSDVVLGGNTNGIELAQAARALRPALPVLLTSGYELGNTDTRHEFRCCASPIARKNWRAPHARPCAGTSSPARTQAAQRASSIPPAQRSRRSAQAIRISRRSTAMMPAATRWDRARVTVSCLSARKLAMSMRLMRSTK